MSRIDLGAAGVLAALYVQPLRGCARFASVRDRNKILNVTDPGRRPGSALCLLALRPGTYTPGQGNLAPVSLHLDLLRIQKRIALECGFDLFFDARWRRARLDGDVVVRSRDPRQVEHCPLGSRPLVFPVNLAFQSQEAFLHGYLNSVGY